MYDSNLWQTDMQEKSTLTVYRKYKNSIKESKTCMTIQQVPPHYLK